MLMLDLAIKIKGVHYTWEMTIFALVEDYQVKFCYTESRD